MNAYVSVIAESEWTIGLGIFLSKPGRKQHKNLEREKWLLLTALDLPQDVVNGDTIMTWIGKSRLKIENYRNILLYTDEHIRIQTKRYKVGIRGKQLCIRYYDKDEMEIYGSIESVNLE